MERSQAGFLIPSLRRLEKFYSLVIRNLRYDIKAADPPNVFYLLRDEDRILYRSECISRTCNPAWAPMEWTNDLLAEEAKTARGRQAVTLQVFDLPSAVVDDYNHDFLASKWSFGAYLPSDEELCELVECSIGRACSRAGDWLVQLQAELLVELHVDLRDLQFLGFNMIKELASISPEHSQKLTLASIDGSPDSAVQLDALPLNTCLFILDDGHYVLPDTYRHLRNDAIPASSPLSPASTRPSPMPSSSQSAASVAEYDLRQGFDVANRLMQLQRDVKKAKAEKEEALCEIDKISSELLSYPAVDLEDQLSKKRARVAELRARRNKLQRELDEGSRDVDKLRASLHERATDLRTALESVQKTATMLPAIVNEVEKQRSEVTLIKNLMAAKQLSLLAELRSLYPIVEVVKGKEYSIRGLKIPDKDLHLLPDEQISTALGYVCHLVALLSKYLQVPLRYFPQHMGSRSSVRDETTSGAVEYPLYAKGVDLTTFNWAVHFLKSDVRQLLYSQGITPGDNHMLALISRLLIILLDAPLPASADVTTALEATSTTGPDASKPAPLAVKAESLLPVPPK